MRTRAALLLLLTPLVSPAWASDQAAKVFAAASPSVFSIGVITTTGDARVGSGVAVAPGRIVTNFHVVQGARNIYIKQGDVTSDGILESSDEKHDLALLRADRLNPPVVSFGSGEHVTVGQTVLAIGSPRGLELTLSEGIVSSLRTTTEGVVIQTTASISPGSSGGGLFDEQGRLVGLTTAQVSNGQNLNFAVPVEWLRYVGVAVGDAPTAPAAAAPAAAPAPAATPAAAPAAAPVAATAQAAPPAAKTSKAPSLLFGTLLIVALLVAAKPAANWLAEYMSRDPQPAGASSAALRAATPDRHAPFRAKAREEITRDAKNQDTWLRALEQTGGDQTRALPAYVELRAQALYRAELDRKWAEAQAQTGAPAPTRKP